MTNQVGAINQDVLGIKSVNFEKINEKRLKSFQDKATKIEDKITFTSEQNGARSELKTKMDAVNNAIRNIFPQYGLHQKFAHVTGTTEDAVDGVGSANDYFDVTASSSAHEGTVNVNVEQLATKAIAQINGLYGDGFPINHPFALSNFTINIASLNPVDVPVVIADHDTFDVVINKINQALHTAGAKATALIKPTSQDLYSINIVSDITGDRTINIAGDGDIWESYNNEAGFNAIARLTNKDGDVLETITSPNNTIKLGLDQDGVPINNHYAVGLTLTLKNMNTDSDEYQTISIEKSKTAISDKLEKFVTDYNDLKSFVETQEVRKPNGRDYEDTAYLARTEELRQAKSFLYSINDRIGNGPISSLGSMGIAFTQDKGLEINHDRLTNVLDINYDEVVSFFTQTETGFIPRIVDDAGIEIPGQPERGFAARSTRLANETVEAIKKEAFKVSEKLIKLSEEYEKAQAALDKEQEKIQNEMANIDAISMQASMMQMYFQAMMSQG